MMLVDKSAPTHADSVSQKLSQEGVFLAGKSAMTIGPWIIRSVKDVAKYPHDFVSAFIPYPTVEKTANPYYQGGLGDHLCINPKSKNVEAAWTFVKWYSERGMLPVAFGGRVPSHVSFDKDRITDAFMSGAEKILDRKTLKFVMIDAKPRYAVPLHHHEAARDPQGPRRGTRGHLPRQEGRGAGTQGREGPGRHLPEIIPSISDRRLVHRGRKGHFQPFRPPFRNRNRAGQASRSQW